eukprot:982018-Prymnesium_polylepis.1
MDYGVVHASRPWRTWRTASPGTMGLGAARRATARAKAARRRAGGGDASDGGGDVIDYYGKGE